MKHNSDFDLHRSSLATIDVDLEPAPSRIASTWWLVPFVAFGTYIWFVGLSAILSLF